MPHRKRRDIVLAVMARLRALGCVARAAPAMSAATPQTSLAVYRCHSEAIPSGAQPIASPSRAAQ